MHLPRRWNDRNAVASGPTPNTVFLEPPDQCSWLVRSSANLITGRSTYRVAALKRAAICHVTELEHILGFILYPSDHLAVASWHLPEC